MWNGASAPHGGLGAMPAKKLPLLVFKSKRIAIQQNESRYTIVAYWYQQAGESDPYQIVPVAERVSHDVTLV
ncbi:MAG: hypothetical protein Fur005_24380 [Roseiflexaceae bacterium]